MAAEDKASIWLPHSLLHDQSPDRCLMSPVAVGDGRRQLQAAGCTPGPSVGDVPWEIWISPDGYPQMVPYQDPATKQFFDGDEFAEALRAL